MGLLNIPIDGPMLKKCHAEYLMNRACLNTSILASYAFVYNKIPKTPKESNEMFQALTKQFDEEDERFRTD